MQELWLLVSRVALIALGILFKQTLKSGDIDPASDKNISEQVSRNALPLFLNQVLLQTVKTRMKCSIMHNAAFHQGLHCLLR